MCLKLYKKIKKVIDNKKASMLVLWYKALERLKKIFRLKRKARK